MEKDLIKELNDYAERIYRENLGCEKGDAVIAASNLVLARVQEENNTLLKKRLEYEYPLGYNNGVAVPSELR